jgi:hypothetical protein
MKRRKDPIDEAEEALFWWHNSMPGELGRHGSGFESGGMVWDQLAIGELLAKKFDDRVRDAAREYHKALPLMLAIGPEMRETAEAIYEPRNYSGGLQAAFQVPTRLPMARNTVGVTTVHLCLAGAAFRTRALRAAHAKAHGGKPTTGLAQLRDWLDDQACSLNRVPKWLPGVVAEAREMRRDLLEAYAGAAGARDEARKTEERAEVARLRKVFA